MNSIIKVSNSNDYNSLLKRLSTTGIKSDIIINYNGNICILSKCDKTCEMVLDAQREDDKDLLNILYKNKIFGDSYDYNQNFITSNDTATIKSISNIFSGGIDGKNLIQPKNSIKNFECFKYFTGITSINPIGENNNYLNFFAAQDLETICLPYTIKELPTCAFAFCLNLKNVNLNLVEVIKTKSFYFCVGLETLTIPSSVNVIEANAFAKSTNIKTIIMKSLTPCKVYKDTFAGISSDFKIVVPRESINLYKEQWKYVDNDKIVIS